MRPFIVRYGEIAIKGGHREEFEHLLWRNIRRMLARKGFGASVRFVRGRIIVYSEDGAEEVITKAPGVVSVSPGVEVPRDLEAAWEVIREDIKRFSPISFRVETTRIDKSFPLRSQDVNAELGRRVVETTGWRVDLSNPSLTIGLEIYRFGIVVYYTTLRGPGGLPVGTQGKAVCLLSGGIDSPVAAYLVIRRGCTPVFVHFRHGEGEEENVRGHVALLREYLPEEPEFIVEDHLALLGRVVPHLRALDRAEWTCVMCKYLMLRRAGEIAEEVGADAVVMGDSLGQVASQTLRNIRLVDPATPLPVLRPLIGLDKWEIEELGRRIGTYQVFLKHTKCECPYRPKRVVTWEPVEEFQTVLNALRERGAV
jgi:thiamine biosynthesis protein ThiI